FRVWIVPTSYIPTSGTQITAANGTQIGGNFNDQDDWQSFSDNELDISSFAGQTMRLVFEWRNDTSGGTQPHAAIDNIHLEIPSCPAPSDLVVSNITINSADINWTAGTTETEWEVKYGDVGFDPLIEGTTVSASNDSETTINNLDHSTAYEVYVRAICDVDDESAWVGPVKFMTLCSPGTIPFHEGFEIGYTDDTALGGCWSQSGTKWTTHNQDDSYGRTSRTGDSYISLIYGSDDWIFYPLDLTGGTAYELSFYARQDASSGAQVMASFGVGDSAADMTNEILSSTEVTSSTYKEFSGIFTPSNDGVYYIGIKGTTTYTPWYLTIDDISVDVICEPVTDVTISNITHTTATVDWTASALANDGYIVNVYEEGADITTATAVFTETIADGTIT